MPGTEVKIEGLREVMRSLATVDKELQKELKQRLKRVAQMAVPRVQMAVPEDSGRWRRSIRAGAGVRGAWITWGRASVPYAPWLEFGGTIAPRGTPIERRFLRRGRYVHPAIDRYDPEIGRAASDAIQVVIRKAGFS